MQVWRIIWRQLPLYERQPLAQTSRMFRKLWLEPGPGSGQWSRFDYWRNDAGVRLWCGGGTPGSPISRGGFVVSEAIIAPSLSNEDQDAGEVCDVITLQLHLRAHQLQALAALGQACSASMLLRFASSMMEGVDATLDEGHYQPAYETTIMRLQVFHNAGEVSDRQRDGLASLFWNFPSRLRFPATLFHYEDTWALLGPGSTARIGWGLEQDLRCPKLSVD